MPPCQDDYTTWNAGFGGCTTYGIGEKNNPQCATDALRGYRADQVCPQCGACMLAIVLKILVCCVDYGHLLANSSLLWAFETGVANGIVSILPAGITEADVRMLLAPGSVQVFATITPPGNIPMAQLTLAVSDTLALATAITSNLRAIQGLSTISSGTVKVITLGCGVNFGTSRWDWSFNSNFASSGFGLPWEARTNGSGVTFTVGPAYGVEAVDFDGAEGSVLQLDTRPLGGGGISICGAARPRLLGAVGNNNTAVVLEFVGAQADSIAVGISGTGALLWTTLQGEAAAQLVVDGFWQLGAWVHFCVTVDENGALSAYRNGMLAGQTQGNMPRRAMRSSNWLGRGRGPGGRLNGSLAALVVIDGHALTADEALDEWLAVGAWKLAMTIDGMSSTWRYDSPIWQNCTPFSAGGNSKTALYCEDFSNMALIFSDYTPRVAKYEAVEYAAWSGVKSLQEMFTGNYVPTTLGVEAWRRMVPRSGYQPHCNREGFVSTADTSTILRRTSCRFGILMNNEDDCVSPDSYIGIGCQVSDNVSANMSAGSQVRLGRGNGDFPVQAHVWVQVSPRAYSNLGRYYCYPSSVRTRLSISALSLEHCQALCDMSANCSFVNFYPNAFWTACYACPAAGWKAAFSSTGFLYQKTNKTRTTTSTTTATTSSATSTTTSTRTTTTVSKTSTSSSTTTTTLVFAPFFLGTIGSQQVFASFEGAVTAKYGESFLQRLPSNASEQTQVQAVVQGGSCGGPATLQFRIGTAALAYFQTGIRGQWSDLTDVRVVSGVVPFVPAHLWMGGLAGNQGVGWILAKDTNQNATTLASSYNGSARWDLCNGHPLRGGETVRLSYSVAAEIVSDRTTTTTTAPIRLAAWTRVFQCSAAMDRRLEFEPQMVQELAGAATRLRLCRSSWGMPNQTCVESVAGGLPIRMLREGLSLSHPNGSACGVRCITESWTGPASYLALMVTYAGRDTFQGALHGQSPFFASDGVGGLALSVSTGQLCHWFGGEESIEVFVDSQVENASCPDAWLVTGSTCYRAFRGPVDQVLAGSACFAAGAQLAKVDSLAGNAAARQLAQALVSGPVWIGAQTGPAPSSGRAWADGSPLSLGLQAWQSGEPSGGAEECAMMSPDGSWYDALCSAQAPAFLCSVEATVWVLHAARHCYDPRRSVAATPRFANRADARRRCTELGRACWGIYDGGCEDRPGDSFLCQSPPISSSDDLGISESQPPSCVMQKLFVTTAPITRTSTVTSTTRTRTTITRSTTTVTTRTTTITTTLEGPLVTRAGPFNASQWVNLTGNGGINRAIGGALSFAAAITMTANPYGLSRVFDFSNSSGGSLNSDFTDAIGVRSHPDSSLFFYMYGGSGGPQEAVNSVSVPGAWNVGEEAMWLFTASASGDLKVYKNGHLLAESPAAGGGAWRSVYRPFLIVGRHPWYGQGWHGSIKSVKVWHREVAWEEVASCSTFACPVGLYNKTGKVALFCATSPCGTGDAARCCDTQGQDEWPNAYRRQRGCADEVPLRNLVGSGFVDYLDSCYALCVSAPDCIFFTYWPAKHYCNRYRTCTKERYSDTSDVYKIFQPWKFAMSINGSSDEWRYTSDSWQDCFLSQYDGNSQTSVFADPGNSKTRSYCDNFQSLRLVFKHADGGETSLHYQGDGHSSLRDVMSGSYIATSFGIAGWQGMVAEAPLLANCSREGFMASASSPGTPQSAMCRFGILLSHDGSCGTLEAFVGVGCQTSQAVPLVSAGTYLAGGLHVFPVAAELWIQTSQAAVLKVHTCDTPDAGTLGDVQVRFSGGDWMSLNLPGRADHQRDQWDIYQVAFRSMPTHLSFRLGSGTVAVTDAWCMDAVQVGTEVEWAGLPRWFRTPCANPSINSVPCSRTFSLVLRAPTWCDQGIVGSFGGVVTCCGAACGACTEVACAQRPEGADLCCPSSIVAASRNCSNYRDYGCLVDASFGYYLAEAVPGLANSSTCGVVAAEAASLYNVTASWCCSDLDDSCYAFCSTSPGSSLGFEASAAVCRAQSRRLCYRAELLAEVCANQSAPCDSADGSGGQQRRWTRTWTLDPCDSHEFMGAVYTRSTNPMSFTAAKRFCQEQGAQPVSIRSAAENAYVSSAFCAGGGACCFLGLLKDLGNNSTPTAQQTWTWYDQGDIATFTAWHAGEPANNASVDKNTRVMRLGEWYDVNASTYCTAVCKRNTDCHDLSGTYYTVAVNGMVLGDRLTVSQDELHRCSFLLRDSSGTDTWILSGSILTNPFRDARIQAQPNGDLEWSNGYISTALERVTCMFTADSSVDAVYFDGDRVDGAVANFGGDCESPQRLTFFALPEAVLGIAVHDERNGTGPTKSFSLFCEATVPTSKWNFALNSVTAPQHVRVFGSMIEGPPDLWFSNNFADHLSWAVPSTDNTAADVCEPLQQYGAQQVWYDNVKYNYYRVLAEAVGPTTSTTTTTTSKTSTTGTTTTTSSTTSSTSTTTSTTTTTSEGTEEHWAMQEVCAFCVNLEATRFNPDVWLEGQYTLQGCQDAANRGGYPFLSFKPRAGKCKLSTSCTPHTPYPCDTCTTEYFSCDLSEDAGYIFAKVAGALVIARPFIYDKALRTFTESVLYCHTLGTRIASIHSTAEQLNVEAIAATAAYLGATSNANGIWTWLDGTEWDYVEDASTTAGVERAVLSMGPDGNWSTRRGDEKLAVVCRELPPVNWNLAYVGYFWDHTKYYPQRVIMQAAGTTTQGSILMEHATESKSGVGSYNTKSIELNLDDGVLLAGTFSFGIHGARDSIRWTFGPGGPPWLRTAYEESCSVALSGHPDRTYNGEYQVQWTLMNGELWYRKSSPARILYFYSANSGGIPRWALDYRVPPQQDGTNDWYVGGWREGRTFPQGTNAFKDPADFYNLPERYLNIKCGHVQATNFLKVKRGPNSALTLEQMDDRCATLGGRLASITSASEQAYAQDVCVEGDACYIGLRWVNGSWNYSDGTFYDAVGPTDLPSSAYQNFAPGHPAAGPAQPCVAILPDTLWYTVPCPDGSRRFNISGAYIAGICKVTEATTTTTTTTTTIAPWSQLGEANSRCNRHDDGHDILDKAACQAEAVAAGDGFFSYSIVGGLGPTGALCAIAASCDFAQKNTLLPWKIFAEVSITLGSTTTTTTQDLATRKTSAVLGEPCELGGFAMVACRAVVRAKALRPADNLEFIGLQSNDCTDWMIANGSDFRSITLVGPDWQRCLVASYRAHPTTRFTTVDFCLPPEFASTNVFCGTFQEHLPEMDWGVKGYLASYQAGVAYEAKVDLVTSIVVKELARVRGL